MAADFRDSWEQRSWEFALSSYSRSKKALQLSVKLNHLRGIEYWQKNIKDLEKKYPILKNIS